MKESIFQTVWDRLICLENLNLVKPGWRNEILKHWTAYRAMEQPEILERLQQTEARDLERSRALEDRKATLQKAAEERISIELEFKERKAIAIKGLRNMISNLETISEAKTFRPEARKLMDRCQDLHTRIERTQDYQTLLSYPQIFNETHAQIKDMISRYSSWAVTQGIPEPKHKIKPIEQYSGDWSQVSNINSVEMNEGDQKVVDRLRFS
jgi:hypothetical protein